MNLFQFLNIPTYSDGVKVKYNGYVIFYSHASPSPPKKTYFGKKNPLYLEDESALLVD